MKKKTKLALSILEKELNVLSKIETLHVLGGADPMHGDVWIVGGETYVWDSNAGMWTGQIPEIVISRNPYQSSSGYNFNTWTWSNMLTGQSGGFMLSSSGYMDLGPISGGGGGGGGTGNPPPTSNLFSMSAFMGYAGLLVEKNAAAIEFTAQQATELADIKNALQASKVMVIAGKYLGVAGSLLTAHEGLSDSNGFTWGDGAKVGIGIITTFTPYGWAYAIVDLGTGIITGTTLTDSIGNAIDGL